MLATYRRTLLRLLALGGGEIDPNLLGKPYCCAPSPVVATCAGPYNRCDRGLSTGLTSAPPQRRRHA